MSNGDRDGGWKTGVIVTLLVILAIIGGIWLGSNHFHMRFVDNQGGPAKVNQGELDKLKGELEVMKPAFASCQGNVTNLIAALTRCGEPGALLVNCQKEVTDLKAELAKCRDQKGTGERKHRGSGHKPGPGPKPDSEAKPGTPAPGGAATGEHQMVNGSTGEVIATIPDIAPPSQMGAAEESATPPAPAPALKPAMSASNPCAEGGDCKDGKPNPRLMESPRLVNGEILLPPLCGEGDGPQLLPKGVRIWRDERFMVHIDGIAPVNVEIYIPAIDPITGKKDPEGGHIERPPNMTCFQGWLGMRLNFQFKCSKGHKHWALITPDMAPDLVDFVGQGIGFDCSTDTCCGCTFVVQ
ncbi:hypothetical protein EPO05_04855 [Patescibacteria group bacterium]|nr:MAG: hypothetical protein EPO05_04855 [Patescibacteria group bacterium]